MNAIEITGLRKAYPDFELAGLDLCLPGGCIMGLIGENGAGKSTTIRLILDMIKPDAGSIKLFGRPNSERALKADIGVVLDEVGFPDCLTAAQANKVLRKAYKNWDEDAFFGYLKKLSIPESKPFGDFSRGMKMKLGIAAELDAIDRGSMIGRRDGRYGSEAIIRRAAAPAGLSLSPVSIEELFIFMVKEGGRQ